MWLHRPVSAPESATLPPTCTCTLLAAAAPTCTCTCTRTCTCRMCASPMSRVHSHACIRQYVQALRPVSGGVPGAPSPAQQLLELGDALLTINGARGDGVYRGCRGAGVHRSCTGSGGGESAGTGRTHRQDGEGVLARGTAPPRVAHAWQALHLLASIRQTIFPLSGSSTYFLCSRVPYIIIGVAVESAAMATQLLRDAPPRQHVA